LNKQLFTTIEVLLIGGLILVVLYWGGVFEPRPAPTPMPPATSTPAATATAEEPTATPAPTLAVTRTPRPTRVPSITPTNPPLVQPTGLIAFESTRDGNTEIYTTTIDGSIQTNLTNNPADDFNFLWSPDGTRIAFLSTRTGWLEMFMMDANGANVRQLSHKDGTGMAYSAPLAWSADGQHILALNFKVWLGASDRYTQQLELIETDGSGARIVYDDDEAYLSNPQWMPDSRHFTVSVSSPRLCGTYIAELASGALTYTPVTDTCDILEWSPDGTLAAYSTRDVIFVLNADGTEAFNVPELSNACGCALYDWSPDGQHILYMNDTGAVDAISLDGVRQVSLRLLINNNYSNHGAPTWSPDSQWLTFIDTQQLDVSIVNIYDPTNRILVTHTNNNYAPQWQP
jgi:Tol biopolymer transport system component